MPLYRFNLYEPGFPPLKDDEGMTLTDDFAARREALATIADMLRASGPTMQIPYAISVEIEREGQGVIDFMTGYLTANPSANAEDGETSPTNLPRR